MRLRARRNEWQKSTVRPLSPEVFSGRRGAFQRFVIAASIPKISRSLFASNFGVRSNL